MSGQRTGRIYDRGQPNHSHVEGHPFNLTAGGMLKQCALSRDAMSTSHEVIKLITYSPKKAMYSGTSIDVG